jgi:hypothetical protein
MSDIAERHGWSGASVGVSCRGHLYDVMRELGLRRANEMELEVLWERCSVIELQGRQARCAVAAASSPPSSSPSSSPSPRQRKSIGDHDGEKEGGDGGERKEENGGGVGDGDTDEAAVRRRELKRRERELEQEAASRESTIGDQLKLQRFAQELRARKNEEAGGRPVFRTGENTHAGAGGVSTGMIDVPRSDRGGHTSSTARDTALKEAEAAEKAIDTSTKCDDDDGSAKISTSRSTRTREGEDDGGEGRGEDGECGGEDDEGGDDGQKGEEGGDGGEGKEENGGGVGDGDTDEAAVRRRELKRRGRELEQEASSRESTIEDLLKLQRFAQELRARKTEEAGGRPVFRTGENTHAGAGGVSTGMIDVPRSGGGERSQAWRQWRAAIEVLHIPVCLPADLSHLKVQASRRFGSSVVMFTGAAADVNIAQRRFETGAWAGDVVLEGE